MRPKVYDSYADQKRDQRIGFIAFPLVNVLVWLAIILIQQQIDPLDRSAHATNLKQIITFLPWAVNGIAVLGLLVFRWSIGTGYLVALAGFGVTAVGLGLLGVVTFFVFAPLLALADIIGVVIFLLVVLAIGIVFLWKMFGYLRAWWKI